MNHTAIAGAVRLKTRTAAARGRKATTEKVAKPRGRRPAGHSISASTRGRRNAASAQNSGPAGADPDVVAHPLAQFPKDLVLEAINEKLDKLLADRVRAFQIDTLNALKVTVLQRAA